MELEIEPYSALPCRLLKFTVNGKEAFDDDFGYSETYGDVDAYKCSNYHFIYNI